MKTITRWQRIGSNEDCIASLMVSNFELFADAVAKLFEADRVAYSGIITSLNEKIANGEKIEKSCYNKGGFKFLYRSYATPNISETEFPTDSLISILENVFKIYLKDITDFKNSNIYIDSCWAVCQREGDYGTLHNHVSPHDHGGSLFSGMFYLKTPATINPETFPDGCLHLITEKGVLYLPPIPGSVSFWPANLIHGIHPFRGTGDRLGIAFNLVVN